MFELEKIRSTLKRLYIIFAVLLFATIYVCYVYFSLNKISFYAIVSEIMLMIASTSKLRSRYRIMFKEIFVEVELKKLFDNLHYNPEEGLSYDVVASTNMMDMGDRYTSNDYISGKYKGINFEQSDIHIEEEHVVYDKDGNPHVSYTTIFKGRWLIFEFNKSFKAKVQISQKWFRHSKVQTFWGKKNEKFKKIKMESERFNKNFNIYAQDEHDAFYLITPSLMERIENLIKNNDGKFLFCFIDQKLHIGIQNGKDSFEPISVFKKLDLEKIGKDVSNDMRVITQFVDELNLDNKLFKVEV